MLCSIIKQTWDDTIISCHYLVAHNMSYITHTLGFSGITQAEWSCFGHDCVVRDRIVDFAVAMEFLVCKSSNSKVDGRASTPSLLTSHARTNFNCTNVWDIDELSSSAPLARGACLIPITTSPYPLLLLVLTDPIPLNVAVILLLRMEETSTVLMARITSSGLVSGFDRLLTDKASPRATELSPVSRPELVQRLSKLAGSFLFTHRASFHRGLAPRADPQAHEASI